MSAHASYAEDWGAYALIPASAPWLVLEARAPEASAGTPVSIGKPDGSDRQKWIITPRGDGSCSVRPFSGGKLVLAAARGGTTMGTPIVLEADSSRPWQAWTLRKNENGSYCLLAGHAPEKGLDHLGGRPEPGAVIDLWGNQNGDPHLEWIIKPLAGSPGPFSTGEGASPGGNYMAPGIHPEAIRQGQLKRCTFSGSTIFPGTRREVTVFIPAQYDGAQPACVYVRTDGYDPAEKPLLETLIATGEMPVTIAVFVPPGELKAPVRGTSARRNRCFEYDGMGDNNVRFLVDELLPFVADTLRLKLSTSGNDRCIAGGSSGGIAAFNAAWERPDAFSRVYACSGSFVAFRGGNEFPTLVRKFEARPLRAFLTTGTRDMENFAGDWFLLDQEMDKALKFSGYDYRFRVLNGGHGAGYHNLYREAMSFLWKGWPRPVSAGSSAPRVRDIILPGEPWRVAAPTGTGQPDRPATNAAKSSLSRKSTARFFASGWTARSASSLPTPVMPAVLRLARQVSSSPFPARPEKS